MMGHNLSPTANDKAALTVLLANGQNKNDSTTTTEYAEDAAAQDAIDTAETEARTNTQSAVNNGINKSKAGTLGEHQANSALTNSYADRYSGYKTQGASTQADYLKSQGQMLDTYNQLNNAKNGAYAARRYGALSGAASGASLGLSVSDENNKESPEPTNIIDLIKQFVDLTNRVNELRKENN